jgi:hypothetical protein
VIEGADKSELGTTDAGAEREQRVQLCTRHPWCIETAGHAGNCTLQDGRTLYEPPEYDPRRSR